MALLNDMYVFVESEDLSSNIEVNTHPVEKGIDLTDHIQRKPMVLSLSGEFVGKGFADTRKKIQSLHEKGSVVQYVGRKTLKKGQITALTLTYNNQIRKGCFFTMEITEVRFAKVQEAKKKKGKPKKGNIKNTKPKTQAGAQQVQGQMQGEVKGKLYHFVKKGETIHSIANKYAWLGASVKKIMKNNADAPKVVGDWKTLQIGTKLWVAGK